MKVKHTLTIRSRLFMLIAACIIPAFLMAAALLYGYYDRVHSRLIRESEAVQRSLAFAVDRELASLETTLLALADSANLASGDLDAFDRQARAIVQDGRIDNIVLTDVKAQQIVNIRLPRGSPLPLHGSPELIQRVVTAQRPVTSDLFTGRLARRPLTNIAVPVRKNNAVTGVLVGAIEPGRFTDLLMQQLLPTDQVAGLMDRSGAVIARIPHLPSGVGRPGPESLIERLKSSAQGELEAITLEGKPALMLYSRSELSGWTVYVAVPKESFTRGVWGNLAGLLLVTLVLFATMLLVAWRMSAQITNAIRMLGVSALALGEGKAVSVPPLPLREINELGNALTRASARLVGANAARSQGDARMSGILESAMDAIVTVDEQKTILLFNSSAAVMFDCPAQQAIGSSITRFIPERFHTARAWYEEADMTAAPLTEASAAIRLAVGMRSGGEEFPVEVSFSSVVESGASIHTLIIRDVTARVRAYEALERSNLDLQQFAYVASHDLKTPLRSISGFVQMLQRDHASHLDDHAIELIRRTLIATSRLDQLTDDLLSFARVNKDIRPFSEVDCREVLDDVIQLLDASIKQTGATVTVGPMPAVMGDRTQLVQLLLNLVGNSLKYCRHRAPVIDVSAVRTGNAWEFCVADNGIGIDARHHEKIFEVFKRLHNQNEFPGTGIGLAVCRRVVDRHAGRIWVESIPGEGSKFMFTIPHSISESTPS